MNERLEWALNYIAHGWPVLPLYPVINGKCQCPDNVYKVGPPEKWKCSPGKHPYANLRSGAKDATLDEERVRMWWGPTMWPHAGVAVNLGMARLMDIAPDRPADLAEFIARGLPETLTFRSGGGEGHQHSLYLLPESVPQTRLCLPGRYDIMSAGYCVMPPTLHASGNKYEWLVQRTTVPPPRWACELLIDHIEGRTPAAEVTVPGDAVLGQNGEPPADIDTDVWAGVGFANDRSAGLWAIAGELAEAGANEATIIEALRERDESLGWHKFTNRKDRDERYTQTARRQLANAMPRIHLGGNSYVNGHASGPSTANFAQYARTAPQFMHETPEQVDWLVEGLIARGGITELSAKIKVGKTELAAHLVHAITSGADSFLGLGVTQSRVLYLTEQGSSFRQALERARLAECEDLWVVQRHLISERGWKWIVEQATAFCIEHDIGLLVVDTLSRFARIHDENSSGEAMAAMNPLQTAIAHNVGVLVIRHDRKLGGDLGDSARGSSAFGGEADIILNLRRPSRQGTPPTYRILLGLGRYNAVPETLVIELTAEGYIAHGDVRAVAASVVHDALVEALGKNGKGRDARRLRGEVVAEVKHDRSAVRSELNRMITRDEVRVEGTGNRGDPQWVWLVEGTPRIRLVTYEDDPDEEQGDLWNP